MRYHVTMLCGGQSMMLTPSETTAVDLRNAADILGDSVLRSSEDMVEFMFREVKITAYANGSLMFYHFTDLDSANAYSDEILHMIS